MKSTAAIIVNRVVKLSTATGNIKHTTGTSGRIAQGVALAGCTAGGSVPVQFAGVVTVQASSKAIKFGNPLRSTSGAASTGTFLGGCVAVSTGTGHNVLGFALTTCAAGASKRTISMMMNLTINTPAVV